MEHTVVVGLAAAGLLSNIMWAWPQVVVLRRRRQLGSVSPGTWTLIAVTAAPYVVAGAQWHLWGLLVASVSPFIAALVVLFAGGRAGWWRGWFWVAAAGGLVAALGPPNVLHNFWLDGVALLPQVVRLARSRSAVGVSALAWLLYLAQFLFWAVPETTSGPVQLRTSVVDPQYLAEVTISAALVVLLLVVRRGTSATVSTSAHAPG